MCAAAAVAAALLACGEDPTGVWSDAAQLEIEPGEMQTLTAFGQTLQLIAVVRDAYGRRVSGVDITWGSRDTDAASVDMSGLVTARGDGTTYIVALSDELRDSVLVVVARPITPLSLEIVSGDDQTSEVGHELGEPLVVRVLNARGEPVPNHQVLWKVPAADGLLDGQVMHACYGTVPLPVSTDADGFAQVSFTPMSAGPLEVTAHLAANPGLPTTFSSAATGTLALTAISGTRRELMLGESVASLADGGSLKALVTDGAGNPIDAVPVTWRLVAGQGLIRPFDATCEFDAAPHAAMRTGPGGNGFGEPSGEYDLHGLSVVNFVPRAFGTSQIIASIGGPDSPIVTPLLVFQIETTGLVIELTRDYFTGEAVFFVFGPNDMVVPFGMPVEWRNYLPTARIRSTTAPAGGAAFDSGPLLEADRFQFVPGVAGTWEFVDEVSGARGTLTAE